MNLAVVVATASAGGRRMSEDVEVTRSRLMLLHGVGEK